MRTPEFQNLRVGEFPRSAQELMMCAAEFATVVAKTKATPLENGFHWYLYDTLAALRSLAPLLRMHFRDLARAAASGPILDIGCGDGDLGLFLASLGSKVTAIDNPPTNYNLMKGIRALSARLNLPVEIVEMNVDSEFTLTGGPYGFALLLGLLYHLKNPFYVLETLAQHARYCMLSTRVATVTKARTKIGNEPLVYLLDHREANDDATNFWIFSPAGLRRLARRTGWRIIGDTLAGCTKHPNPNDPEKDGRMFMFLESQRLSVPAEVTLLNGWTEVSEFKSAWTLKRFSFVAHVLDGSKPSQFFLGFSLTREMVANGKVTIRCNVNGAALKPQIFNDPGEHLFQSLIPDAIDNGNILHFEFIVDHQYKPQTDLRDLGVIVLFTGAIRGISEKLTFWLG